MFTLRVVVVTQSVDCLGEVHFHRIAGVKGKFGVVVIGFRFIDLRIPLQSFVGLDLLGGEVGKLLGLDALACGHLFVGLGCNRSSSLISIGDRRVGQTQIGLDLGEIIHKRVLVHAVVCQGLLGLQKRQ